MTSNKMQLVIGATGVVVLLARLAMTFSP